MARVGEPTGGAGESLPRTEYEAYMQFKAEEDPNNVGDEQALMRVAQRLEDAGYGKYGSYRDKGWFGKEGYWQNPRLPGAAPGYGAIEKGIFGKKHKVEEAALVAKEEREAKLYEGFTQRQNLVGYSGCG
jgi:hypothetical protein